MDHAFNGRWLRRAWLDNITGWVGDLTTATPGIPRLGYEGVFSAQHGWAFAGGVFDGDGGRGGGGEGSSSSSSSSKTSAESGAEASGDGAEDVFVDMLHHERKSRESRGRVVSPGKSPGVLPGLEQMWCESAKDLPRNLKVGCSCRRDWQCKSRSCPHEDGEPWQCAAQQEGSCSEGNLVGGAQLPRPIDQCW